MEDLIASCNRIEGDPMRSMPRTPHDWRVGLSACALLLAAPFAAAAFTSPAHSTTSSTSQASTAQTTSVLENTASHD
jgi:hypothetical protein